MSLASGATPEPVLRLEGVSVAFGHREVLHIPELTVQRGDALAVLGPNGAGKSTLLHVAALLRRPTSGSVTLFGERARGRRSEVALRRRTASVFGEPTLLDMPVRANVEAALRMRGVPREDRRRRTEGWLDRLGVLTLAEARPHTLSAGEAQRVSLARAFVVEPELLLLDEPFSAVDIESRMRLAGELRELLAETGTTALIATHDRGEAALLARSALVLLDGCPAQHGRIEDLFAAPASVAVASFLGHALIEAAHAHRLGLADPPPGHAFSLPPDALRLVEAGAAGAIEAQVLALRGGGGRTELVVDLGAPVGLDLPVASAAARNIEVGAVVHVQIDRGRVVPVPLEGA